MRTCCASCCPAPWSTSAIRPIPAPTCRSAGSRAMTASRSPARRSTSMTAGRRSTGQIELAREVLKARTPLFGSCWGLQVDHRRGGRHGARQPEGPRDRRSGGSIALTPAGREHPMYAGKALGVRRRHGASRRGRDAGARHHGAGGERAVRRAGGRDRGRRRGRLGRAVSSGILARRHGGDRAALRAAADAAKASSPTRRRATPTWRISKRSTASRTTSRSPGATASTRPCSTRACAPTEIANWIAHQVLPTRAKRGRG